VVADDRIGDDMSVSASSSLVSVLVVDDDAGKRLSLKAVLSPLGYSIVEADSGLAALRCVMAQDFAVILLDVRMPIMDGIETAALIRQRRQSEMTPIIFITASWSEELVNDDRYAEGAVDFMFAPVPADELRAKVSVFANLFLNAETLATQAREVQTIADELKLVADAAPIGIFRTDIENRYVYTNPRWTEITGMPPEVAVGQKWDTIMSREERARLSDEVPGGAADEAELCHRFQIHPSGSASRIALVTSKRVLDVNGHMEGWVGILADVTAEAGAEAAMSAARDEATKASRLKSDFLANMSHEVRTPMNGVIGMTDLLLETDLDARQRDYAQTVRNSGEALLTVINDILDFSKVEAGKLEVEDIEFDMRMIVDDVVNLLAGQAQAKGLELVAVLERSLPRAVSGDPGRVRQVLTNLIGNAIKFTQAGEVVVRVTEAEPAGADTVVRFEVSDTGVGIAPEQLDAIFQPFVQADTSTSRKYGGTGLGLAISGQLVALMGGDCGVSSRLGTGSTFWFTIRAHVVPGQEMSDQLSPDPALAGVTALIVDDNATQRGVLSEYLTDWGMSVRTTDSGQAALARMRTAAFQGRPFAVALLDRSMPGMDGLALKDAIVADPGLTAPLILMTDLGREREFGDTAESGICASLSKPVHREDLLECLHVALGLRTVDVIHSEVAARQHTAPREPEAGRLLLAEDNLINQKVAVAMLSSAGYRVDTVLDGEAAVQAVAAQPYDAILMDCQMPELNGYEATAAIRAHEGSARHTPIIAMTAGARPQDRTRCLAEGMDGYLAKPVSKDALLDLVSRSLKSGLPGPPSPAVPVVPALDEQVVGRLERLGKAAGEDLMAKLAVLFVADADVQVVALHAALAAHDAEEVVRSAHSLRGASANLGATVLADLCADLEARGAEGDLEDGGELLASIELELGRVRSAVDSAAPTS
jgi:two-component system, sensor histidine kinase and response regulator